MSRKKLLYKCVIVGDGGVGKTTMVQRLIIGNYIPQKMTIGTDLATYSIEINDEDGTIYDIILQLWDFAGEARFRFFLPNYANGARGCLICYDITRYSSYEHLEEWYNIVNENAANPVYVLVGQKHDLAEQKRVVNVEKAREFQERHNIPHFFETSSKTGYNNKIIFKTLAKEIIKKSYA
ncbi:MAG: Rab family GTPase [Promethearchaeota archaeon]